MTFVLDNTIVNRIKVLLSNAEQDDSTTARDIGKSLSLHKHLINQHLYSMLSRKEIVKIEDTQPPQWCLPETIEEVEEEEQEEEWCEEHEQVMYKDGGKCSGCIQKEEQEEEEEQEEVINYGRHNNRPTDLCPKTHRVIRYIYHNERSPIKGVRVCSHCGNQDHNRINCPFKDFTERD